RRNAMRLACPEERLDRLPIARVNLKLNCRDEIIPILRALQDLYANVALRDQLLELVGRDVNPRTSRRCGRRGLNYWEITVPAAARLGCSRGTNASSLRARVRIRVDGIAVLFEDSQDIRGAALEVEIRGCIRPR